MNRKPAWCLAPLYPFRVAVIAFPRHSIVRNLCIFILKFFSRHVSVHDRIVEILPLDRPKLRFKSADSTIMDEVYWFGVGGYEGTLAAVWEHLCEKSNNILEIGGNVGLYAVLGGYVTPGQYTVLEPIPHVANILRANLSRNNLTRVELLVAAATPDMQRQEVSLNLPNEGRAAPVGAHLIEGSEVSGRSSERLINVSGIPFREIAKGRDLIKIDAEGIEASLLETGWEIINDDRPTLVIEVLPQAEKLAALIRRLASELGYRIQVVPAYGSDVIVSVEDHAFLSTTPAMHNSKDVVLSVQRIDLPLRFSSTRS